MSHIPERTEKDCLNCGAMVQGRYCQVCGQENVVPHETFWHMVKHFFYDIMHFDSKFFDTLKDLLFKPGFLSREYISGRRVAYLHPVKMYVFTSAVFFLIFFSFVKPGGLTITSSVRDTLSGNIRQELIAETEKEIQKDTTQLIKERLKLLKDTSRIVRVDDYIRLGGELQYTFMNITGAARRYKTVGRYDSVQRSLPKSQRDGFFKRLVSRKEVELNEEYSKNPEGGLKKLMNDFLHKLPYLLFVSLPLFAFFLQLLYIRRKEFYYVDHGIFSIHHYIFCFILLLLVFTFQGLSDWLGWGIFDVAAVLLLLSGGVYLYKAMRNFYRQRRAKTIIKFILLNLMGFISLVLLFCIFVLLSIFEL